MTIVYPLLVAKNNSGHRSHASATEIPVGKPNQIVAAGLVLTLALLQPAWMGPTVFAQQPGPLRIAVLEGNNSVVKKDKNLRLVVEVRNDSRVPVVGADVTFIAPESGPGILFAENASRLTVKTDSFGRANSGFARSVGDGQFQVTIVASYQGQTASTTAQAVNQTSPASASATKKKSGIWKWILIGAGAGAVGIILATKSGSDSDSPPPPTITVDPPTIGPPQ
jgi:hypothetical protein